MTGTALSILPLLGLDFAQGSSPLPGSIRGDAFTNAASGEPDALPVTRIVLRRTRTPGTDSHAQGTFAIDDLLSGTGQIEVNASLYSTPAVGLSAGTSSTVPVENKCGCCHQHDVTATDTAKGDRFGL